MYSAIQFKTPRLTTSDERDVHDIHDVHDICDVHIPNPTKIPDQDMMIPPRSEHKLYLVHAIPAGK